MRKVKVLPTFLTIIIIIFLTVVFWQYDNISAILHGFLNKPENIALELDKKREELKAKIEKYTTPINDLTAEDERKLLKGELKLEDIAEKYNFPIEYMMEDKTVSDSQIPAKSMVSDTESSKIIEKRISEGISRMYALKAKYVNKLGELEREVADEYSQLPKSKQNQAGKKELVMANMDYVSKLEKTCDLEVGKVISSLEKYLKEYGGDMEIIQILEDAYNDEKTLKKSYYLSLYN